MSTSSRALVLPVARRVWLLHAVTETQQAARTGPPGLKDKVVGKLQAQWETFRTAQPNSIKGWLYRLAEKVQSYEPPEETFLKGLPSAPTPVEVIHPVSTAEALVRRRIRLLLRHKTPQHRWQAVAWGAAAAVFVPLLLTPLPNIPLYYSGWRVYSHYAAFRGGSMLQALLDRLDAEQLLQLREQLIDMGLREDGLPEGSWPAQLIKFQGRYAPLLDIKVAQSTKAQDAAGVSFMPSPSLEHLLAARQPEPPASSAPNPAGSIDGAVGSLEHAEHAEAAPAGPESPPAPSAAPAALDPVTITAIAEAFRMPSLADHAQRARQQWAKQGCLPPAA